MAFFVWGKCQECAQYPPWWEKVERLSLSHQRHGADTEPRRRLVGNTYVPPTPFGSYSMMRIAMLAAIHAVLCNRNMDHISWTISKKEAWLINMKQSIVLCLHIIDRALAWLYVALPTSLVLLFSRPDSFGLLLFRKTRGRAIELVIVLSFGSMRSESAACNVLRVARGCLYHEWQ